MTYAIVQIIRERPVRRCTAQRVSANECKAEHPKFVCEKCTYTDVHGIEEVCASADDFDPVSGLDVSAPCLW